MSICIKIFLALSLGLITSCSNNQEDLSPGADNKAENQPARINVDVDGPAGLPTQPTVPGAPLVTPPPPPPPPIPVPIPVPDHRRGNDDHDHDCPDQDSDGVCDPRDKCPGFDDRNDLDEDGTPDDCDCEPENADVGAGDLCSDTTTCAVSVCDPQGSGDCIVTNAPFGTECGNIQGNECDADDSCDGQGNCINLVQPDGSACGNTALAICDSDDTCVNGDCVDNRALEGTVCRASAGVCDVQEVCDGTFITCPDNVFVDIGTQCRASASECDVAEVCNGGSAVCPPDGFAPDGVICGDAPIGLCDRENQCQNGICEDLLYGEDYLCRSANDEECDVAEFCTGEDVDCPLDIIVDPGTACGEPGSDQEFCSVEAVCTPAGRCVGIPAPDGPTTNECNANNGEPRCDGFINCENGIDVCVPTDGSAIECTEQIIQDPNQPPVGNALALGEPTFFGWATALYGEWAAVGNRTCSDRTVPANGCAGLLYIYKYNSVSGLWEEHQTLSSDDNTIGEGPGTGWSVDMYGDLLIFGQKNIYGSVTGIIGGFTIARLVNDTWTPELSLRNDDNSFDFGNAVSIYTDGGSKQYAMAGGANQIVIWIYNLNGDGQWANAYYQQGATGNSLGFGVRIRGDIALASAPTTDQGGFTDNGSFKVLHRSGNTFVDSYNIYGGANNENLGTFSAEGLAIDPDNNRLFVGNSLGQAKIYLDNGSSATLQQTITNGNPATVQKRGFGSALTLNGSDTLILGDSIGNSDEGLAYIYVFNGTNWFFQETITPGVASVDQSYGWSVSANQGKLIVGGPAGTLTSTPSGISRVYFYGLIP